MFLRLNKNLRRNSAVLLVTFAFFAAVFAAAAQTRTPRKTASTASAKKTPTPAPKKTDKKSPAAKSADKKEADKKSSKTTAEKKSANTKSADKKPAATKTAAKQNTKSAAKTVPPPAKTSPKTVSKTAAAKQNSASRKPAETNAGKPLVKAKNVESKPVAQNAANSPAQAIVTVSAARVRAEPSTNSAEIRRVKLGTLVRVIEENPTWYKIELAGASKKTGWMSKQIADEFDDDRREEIYRRITDRNFKSDKMSFTDAAELYEFLSRAQNEVKNSPLSSEIAYKKLLSLRSALKTVPFGKSSEKPYSDFLKANEKFVVYSEPAGQWYVRSELLWDLNKKYSKESFAEEAAWTAAQNPLPGECEGYINCYLFFLRETDGEYLMLYPNGKYAEQSLKNVQNLLEPIAADLSEKKVYTGPSDVSDRAEFNRLIAELRTIVSKLPFAEIEKQKTIQQLNRIAEGYR